MGNGVNVGKGNSIYGDVKNEVTIKKSHFTIGLTVTISLLVILVMVIVVGNGGNKTSVLGRWVTDDGQYIEFLSDGTLSTDIFSMRSESNPDTYEIMKKEGYLKWGRYDPSMIQYDYTYWNINIVGNKMTLTIKDGVESINLIKE